MEKPTLKITFLGTGANGGVPQLDCSCCTCQSGLIRKRSSLLVESGNEKLIVDCGPDFKSQLIDQKLKLNQVSAITLTHLHWDHCSGLTELSAGKNLNIPLIVPAILKKGILQNHSFNFLFKFGFASFNKQLKRIRIKHIKVKHAPQFDCFAVKITIGVTNIIYAPDIAEIDSIFKRKIQSADIIIFDGTFLNESKHNHISIFESLNILKNLKAKVIFTHINHSENKINIEKMLQPFKFKLAKDRMVLKL